MKEGMMGKNIGSIGMLLMHFPLTYNGILRSLVGHDFKTLLDVGCGTGLPMEVINGDKRYNVTGVDLYKPYLDECKEKGLYKKLVQADVRRLPFKDKSFDVVICFHLIEHLSKKEGTALIKRLEKLARKRVVLAMPVGHLHQEAYDGNKHQEHKSEWYAKDLEKLGYKVVGQGLRALYGEENVVKKYGIFSYAFFALSMLFQPFVMIKPEYARFMFAKKEFI